MDETEKSKLEHRRAQGRKRYHANKEKYKTVNEVYRNVNKERLTQRRKELYAENREREIARHKSYVQANKEKVAQYRKEYNAAHREEIRAYSLATREHRLEKNRKRMYGITNEELDILYKKQHGLCALCYCVIDKSAKTHIDHCHKTDKVRGLLCKTCNVGLGMLGDTSESLYKAYLYIVESENA